MTSDVDGGAIVATEHFPVTDDETAFSLNARCYEAALASFPRVAAAVASGNVDATPQPDGVHRMFKRHDRPARLLVPSAPAAETARAVRALDLGHRLRNSIGSVRLILGDAVYVVDAATVLDGSDAAPGTLVTLDDGGARIATDDGDLLITALSTATGRAVDVRGSARRSWPQRRLRGVRPPGPSSPLASSSVSRGSSRDERFWLERWATLEPTPLPGRPPAPATHARSIEIPAGVDDAAVVAAVAAWLHRVTSA